MWGDPSLGMDPGCMGRVAAEGWWLAMLVDGWTAGQVVACQGRKENWDLGRRKKKMEFWEGGELWTGRGVSLGEKGEKQSKLQGVFLRSKLEEFPSRRWCLCCHAEESLRIPRYVLFSIDWFGHQRLLICFAKVVCVYMLCLFFLWIPGLSLQIFDAWLHSWTWYG